MRQDWKIVKVAELEKSGILRVEDGNHGEYRPRRSEFGQGETRFIRASNLSNGRVLFEKADRISDSAVDRIRKGVGKGGDIVFSHKGTVGKLAPTPINAPPFVCSPQTTFWRSLDVDRLDPDFLYAFMRSRFFRDQWLVRKGETDMADYVSLTAQRQLTVLLPQIEEQRRIASLIEPFDRKIHLTREINRTLEFLAQSVFKSWFIDFDPVVAKADDRRPFGMTAEVASLFPDRFMESPLGPIPEGWKIVDLKQLLSLERSSVHPQEHPDELFAHFSIPAYDDGQRPIIEPGSTIKSNKYRIPDGVVLISKLNPGTSRIWLPGDTDGHRKICSTEFLVCLPGGWCESHLYCLFGLPDFRRSLESLVTGTSKSHQRVRTKDFLRIQVVSPTKELLSRFDEVTRPMLDMLRANRTLIETLVELRDALLPKVLSDDIRVAEAEEVVEAVNA